MRLRPVLRLLLAGLLAGSAFLAPGSLTRDPSLTRAAGPTNVSGTISSNTTWALANSPYVVTGSILVSTGVTLTIEPGVVVSFAQGTYLKSEGYLSAAGTSTQPITFTSNQANKNKGDWNGIQIRPTGGTTFDGGDGYSSGSQLKYVNVEYASTGVYIYQSGLLVTNSSFSNNSIAVELRRSNHTVFRNNTFANNTTSVYSIYQTYSGDAYGHIVDAKFQNNTFASGSYGIDLNSNQTSLKGIDISNNEFSGYSAYAVKVGGGGYGPYAHSISITNNWIHNNQGGILISNFYSSGCNGLDPCPPLPQFPIDINNNLIINNTSSPLSVGSLDGGSGQTNIRIYKNVLAGNGGEVLFSDTQHATNHVFSNNSISGSGIRVAGSSSYHPDNWKIYENLFKDLSAIAVDVPYGSGHQVYSNNFINSTGTYIIRNSTTSSISATVNYWGTSDSSQIEAKIYDRYDNFEVGEVVFNPFSSSPNTSPPVSSPSNVTVAPGPGAATISWSANPESDVSGYKVYYDTDSGYPYANIIDVGNVTSYTLALNPGAMYYVTLTSYDTSRDGTDDWFDGNESWFSSELVVDQVAPTSPTVSINIGAAYANSWSVNLSVSAQDTIAVTGYYASESSATPSASSPGWNSVTASPNYSGTVPFTFSSGEGTKTVHVWYKDAVGNVSAAASDSIIVDTTPPTSSASPLSAEQASTAFPVAWSGSDTGGGSGLKWYDVQYRDAPSGQWTGWLTQVTTTTATFAGQEGHTYYFRSRAQDNAGNWEDYPASDGDASTTIRDLTAPASAVAAIDTYASAGPSTHSFRVSWSGSDAVSGVASYDIQYKDGAGGTWTDWITQTTSTSAVFTGTVGHPYFFQSRARDLAGNVEAYPGGDGDFHTETTPPSSAVAALSPYQNSTSFTVYWFGSDASGIRSFDVQYKDGASGAWTDWITSTTPISGTFSGQDGHTYYFQARARDVPGNVEAYPGGDGDAHTTVDITLPSGSLWVNGGALGTTAVSVTLGVLANGASHMAFTNDGLNFTDWESYSTIKGWTLPAGDGTKAVYVRFKDLAGNVSGPYSTTVELATGIGQEPGISTNDGALYTNQVTVTLTLPAVPGTSKMMVSNNGDFKGADWEPYSPYKAWAITQYGAYVIPRLVYVKYKDLSAAISSTSVDDIILDVNAPTGSVSIAGSGAVTGTARTGATAATLLLSASDDVSGVGGMLVSNSPAFSGASWEPFTASKSWSMESGGKVYVAFKDNAGNASPVYAAALSGAKESLPAVILGTVHPKTGGTVASSETGTTVSFPPGALGVKAEVTLVPAVESNLRGNTGALKSAGKFLTLTAKAGETSLTSVSKPYTITVGYTAADVAGMDESTLGIYWWNGTAWRREATSRVDTAAKTVSATLDHLSAFALLGESSVRKVYLPFLSKTASGW